MNDKHKSESIIKIKFDNLKNSNATTEREYGIDCYQSDRYGHMKEVYDNFKGTRKTVMIKEFNENLENTHKKEKHHIRDENNKHEYKEILKDNA